MSANIKTWQERRDEYNLQSGFILTRSDNFFKDAEIAELRAALAAKAVPDGWKLVPVEPTCEMIDAFHEADDAAFAEGSQHGVGICMAWNAMLDAAPSLAESSHE